jgi:hypothetical protein
MYGNRETDCSRTTEHQESTGCTMKTDYKSELKQLYSAKPDKPAVVRVPQMNFLMIDGVGDPNTGTAYGDAIQTLYPVAYSIKFMCKKELGIDFTVMPLESLWWSDNMADFSAGNKDNWQWTAMIMQPEIVNHTIYKHALEQAQLKRSLPSMDGIRFASYKEGRAAQVLHVGPYAQEGPAIEHLHTFISEQGGSLDSHNNHHHEIYLSDPRRTAPEKLKTIIRQPF